MTAEQVLQHALDNLRAADRFRRAAESLLDERMVSGQPVSEADKKQILHDLSCYGAHFGEAVEAMAEKR